MTKREEQEKLRRELAHAQARRLAAENAYEDQATIKALTDAENALFDRLYPIEDSLSDEEPTLVMPMSVALLRFDSELAMKTAPPTMVAAPAKPPEPQLDLGPVEDADVMGPPEQVAPDDLEELDLESDEVVQPTSRGLADLWRSWWSWVAATFRWS